MLDLSFLISSIVNLFIGLIFFLFFLYLCLKIDKFPIIGKWMDTKIGKYLIYFFLGFLIGLATLFFSLIQINLHSYYLVVADIALIILCALYVTPFLLVGASISYVSFTILFNYQNHENLLLTIYFFIYYFFLCLIVIFLHFLNRKKFLYFILISIPITAFILVFAVAFVPSSIILFAYILPWITLLYFIVYYLFSIPLINYIGKTKQLSEAIRFDKNNFALSSYVNQFLWDEVVSNKIQFGILLVFNITIKKEKNKTIIELIIKMIQSKINLLSQTKKVYWFLTPLNYYGVFIPLTKDEIKKVNLQNIYNGNNLRKRSMDDLFFSYEIICKSLPNKIKYKNVLHTFDIKSTGIIYGIHSSDFNKMISLCEILIRQYDLLKNLNIIQVFNPREFKSFESDANLYKKLSQKIHLNEMLPYLDECENLNCLTNKYYSINYSWSNRFFLNKYEILYELKNFEMLDTLIRFFAMKGINLFVEEKLNKNKKAFLIIDYSIDTFKNVEFNSKNFLSKLDQHNLDPNNLIINIYKSENVKDIILNKIAIKNINYLNQQGVKFAISSDITKIKLLTKAINIDYYLINKRITNKNSLLKFSKYFLDKNLGIIYPKIK